MRLFPILTAFAASAVLIACGGDSEPDPSIPSEGTILQYSRAGGIAFSIYEVTIDADGSGVARFGSDARNLKEKDFTLSESEVEELRTVLEENPISSFPDPGDTVCADCFEYRYAYGGDEYTASDVTEPVEGLDEVNAFLGTLPLPEDQPNGG